GDYIWAQPLTNGEFDIPLGGRVVATELSRVKIVDDDGNEVYISNKQVLKTMHVSSILGVEDMIHLGDLQEYAILRNLHKRYRERLIYTYIGTMLIAINPYEVLPIYTNALISEYRNRKLEELPPHIFAIGDNSYNNMKIARSNQCIVISGESGAGKTESTKLILQYLASTSGQHSWIEQQILEANPILEAFGNAKTVRNDNSSRFGKYIDINFNKAGSIEGARIDQYLLEKSRLVSQNLGERNYHIFYSMLYGLPKEEKKRLDLADAAAYTYLNGGRTLICQGKDEIQEFSDVMAAFKVLNFSENEVTDIFSLLAAILHLGNLKFKSGTAVHSDTSEVGDAALNEKIARLLGVNKFDLSEALTKRTIYAHGDPVISTLSKEQASESRHAFVKGIYGQLFIMIVNKINSVICQTKLTSKGRIGILDIFGFENFDINSFEQLCINYANENLQQFFIHHIFKLEQDYYTREGINWSNIYFVDNQEILDMLGGKPLNVFSLIDEESKFPKGTDFSLLSKLHNQHNKKSFYKKPKSDLTPSFGIQHYAGEVFYDVPGFLEKNRDSFSQDLKKLISRSENNMLRTIFKNDVNEEASSKKTLTLSSQFRGSLDLLMKTLNICNPFFVRCIKPNEFKEPQAVEIFRNDGNRKDTTSWVPNPIHGKNIPHSNKGDCKESTAKICSEVFKANNDYQLGHTQIFLKHHDNEYLEELRNKVLDNYIKLIQKVIKGWVYRMRYLRLRKAAIVFQKYFRARGYRTRYLIMKNGYQRLQASIQSRQLTYFYNKIRRNISHMQALCRGYLVRNKGQFGHIYSIIKQRRAEEKELQSRGIRNYKVEAEKNMQQRLAECNREYVAKIKAQEEENSKSQVLPNHQGPRLDVSENDLQEYSFRKYAATYFAKNANYQYSKKPLKESLHYLPTPDDVIAAQALWITILRFMGDYPEPKFDNTLKDNEPVMAKVSQTLTRSFTNRKEYQEILKQEKKILSMKKKDRQKLINMTLKRKNKLLDDVRRGLVEDTYAADSYNSWLHNTRTNNLEKDEIFAMICKQLTNNYIKSSYARGWILLSLCVGCFPPSERFINYLRAFIRSGPPGYAPYCEGRLNRTFQNGARMQPPSWLELMATKNKDPINLEITLMDGTVQKVEVDSATISEEVVTQIATTLGLNDVFGFSLFIALYDKVMSLGSESDHIMDAISQCEQYAKEIGQHERNCPWRLFLRKEIFTPWNNPAEDSVATNLIYHQVIRGIKAGEYRCNVETDVASLIATQYYVENGPQISKNILHTRIGEYMPSYLVKQTQHDLSEWENRIITSFSNLICVKEKMPAITAKEFIVKYAQTTWPILFSRFFEAHQISGPELLKKDMIIAVNGTGMFIIDDQEQILLELTYADISFVTYERTPQFTKFLLNTIDKEEYSFLTLDAQNLFTLIQYLLDGLRKRSVYCVATQDYRHPTNAESFLALRKGDLITLKNNLNGEKLMTITWGYGECNGKSGDFPTESIYILPTMLRPSSNVLSAFKKDGYIVNKQETSTVISTIQRNKLYTLASYAQQHFRSEGKLTVSKATVLATARRSSREKLWKYTNEPIYQPLLQKLLEDEYASKEACNIFTAILKYMGDLPAPKAKYSNEYTDQIFGEAMKYDLLKDEVYCQIMKQLTFNRLSLSEERGWGADAELQKFLKSREHPFAEHCLQRLQRTQKVGPRKYPPYSIEVEAIQHKSMEIFHKIYFPDDTDEAFEVNSMTRATDLCKAIVSRLELESADGFSLFVAIADKVFSVPDEVFFYDFLNELINWMRTTKPSWGSATPIQAQYQKLWINTIPGKDPNADFIFHYHQEVPKYLKGYHKCSKQEATKLAALILCARHDENYVDAQSAIQHSLKDIIPVDMIKAASMSEWKKHILAEYKSTKLNSEQAKTMFLKNVYKWPTFGSTFFEVKQTTEPTYPEVIVIAINKRGVNIIHPQTKDILATHEYSELSNWSSGNTYFHLTIGNIMRKTKLLCETSQGYKMDDLITSYTDYFRNEKEKNKAAL
ncbi:hypothetical protein NQ318_014215, partial [Aromia moschata]